MKQLFKILREAIPEAVGALIATAVSVVIGVLFASIWVAIFAMAVALWLGCAYLAFKRRKPTRTQLRRGEKAAWRYPRWRLWGLTGFILVPLLVVVIVGYQQYLQALPPSKSIILVADFDGPEPQKYRVTETILNRLRTALQSYNDVDVNALGRAITEEEGSAAARAEGNKYKATIVIWGWYGVTSEVVLSVSILKYCGLLS